ncbi:3'-5' exonuclease [Methylobacterium radiotolerans]|jgi:DNA polymerase-3 subunit epsilon|uniref:3'-5' exonuclease n=1 Tax=Methylobacterium radiotolerans TaxID=31998 RepID=UPI0038CF5A4B
MTPFEAECHAIALAGSPLYKVLRKLERRPFYDWQLPDTVKVALIIDVETTGVDPNADQIIELAMLRVAYSATGTLLGPIAEFQGFRDPGRPIPAHITHLTGITDAMVAGQTLDEARVRTYVEDVDLIIAHNANFDRRFCERFSAIFEHKAWACSMSQIPWTSEGVGGTKLYYLAFQQSFWFEGHRALDDCYALLEILEMPLPRSHRITFTVLLEAAFRETRRVWAIGTPYQVKDQLKKRGYRWSSGQDGKYRAWHRDVSPDQVETEIRFLEDLDFPEICPIVTAQDAYIRFSDRLF